MNLHRSYPIAAILFEVAGTTSMKLSAGFSKPLPSVLIFLLHGCAVASLTFALKMYHGKPS